MFNFAFTYICISSQFYRYFNWHFQMVDMIIVDLDIFGLCPSLTYFLSPLSSDDQFHCIQSLHAKMHRSQCQHLFFFSSKIKIMCILLIIFLLFEILDNFIQIVHGLLNVNINQLKCLLFTNSRSQNLTILLLKFEYWFNLVC